MEHDQTSRATATGPGNDRGTQGHRRGGRALRPLLALAMLASGLLGGLGQASDRAEAYQAPATAATAGGAVTLTVAGSNVSAKVSGTGLSSAVGSASLGSRGYVPTDFTPMVAPSQVSASLLTNATNSCAAVGRCTGLGTFTIDFSQPVRNPVIHIAGLGGNVYQTSNNDQATGPVIAQSQIVDELNLTTPGVTLAWASGANFVVGSSRVSAINPNAGSRCETNVMPGNPSQSPAMATAGCGSFVAKGNGITRLSFDVTAMFTPTTSAQPAYTNNSPLPTPNQDGFNLAVTFPEDFGDAPASYDQGNAARAVLSDITLGPDVSEDRPTTPNSAVSPYTDGTAGQDARDDGVSPSNLLQGASSYSADVVVAGSSKAGTVCGWVDFDQSGTFDDPAEEACTAVGAGTAPATYALTWSGLPALTPGATFARFRVGYDAARTQVPTGASNAGEVEDYRILIDAWNPEITLDKRAGNLTDVDQNGEFGAGDTIDYSFVVTNTGTVTVHDVAIHDDMVGAVTCVPTTLAPSASAACGPVAYELTQADLDAGSADNTATATATDPDGNPTNEPTDSTSTPLDQTSRISLDKEAGPIEDANGDGTVGNAGDTIVYSFTVLNSGNVTVHDVAVHDDMVGPLTCASTTLAPAASTSCGPATYTLTQADLDGRKVVNRATATATDPDGNPTDEPEDSTITDMPFDREATLDKQAGTIVDASGDGTFGNAGDTIPFTFVITNTGSTTLGNFVVHDQMLGDVGPCAPAVIGPKEQTVCGPVDYTITQDDVDAGSVDNTAWATGDGPCGGGGNNRAALGAETARADLPYEFPCQFDTNQDVTSTPLAQEPLIVLDKSADPIEDANGDGIVGNAGDTIDYSFTVYNWGTVTVHDVAVHDDMVGPLTCESTTLAPSTSTSCGPATYTLTQADVDSRRVVNIATATATDPEGNPTNESQDLVVTGMLVKNEAELDKQAGAIVDANGDGILGNAGDTIPFTFVITNTGITTIGDFVVHDQMLGDVSPCTPTWIAPGAQTTCGPVDYTITQTDVDAGSVDNTASATGKGPCPGGGGGNNRAPQGVEAAADEPPFAFPCDVDTNEDATSTPLAQIGQISLDKQAGPPVDANGDGLAGNVGDTIEFSFVVSNTGTVTVSDVAVDDAMVGAVTCTPTTLAPGRDAACGPVAYVITQADVDAGSVENTASATATDPEGEPTNEPTDSTSTDLPEEPDEPGTTTTSTTPPTTSTTPPTTSTTVPGTSTTVPGTSSTVPGTNTSTSTTAGPDTRTSAVPPARAESSEASPQHRRLPVTGANVQDLAVVGIALALVGVALVGATRRRRGADVASADPRS